MDIFLVLLCICSGKSAVALFELQKVQRTKSPLTEMLLIPQKLTNQSNVSFQEVLIVPKLVNPTNRHGENLKLLLLHFTNKNWIRTKKKKLTKMKLNPNRKKTNLKLKQPVKAKKQKKNKKKKKWQKKENNVDK